jgi:hypothetical protein
MQPPQPTGRCWRRSCGTVQVFTCGSSNYGMRAACWIPLVEGGKTILGVDIVKPIEVDGNALNDNYSSLLPLDFNGNGTSEFLI